MVEYLQANIAAKRQTNAPRWGMTRMGYTLSSGAPTSWLVRLEGEKRWRRLMVWQTSNAGTCFLRVKGKNYVVVHLDDVPEERGEV